MADAPTPPQRPPQEIERIVRDLYDHIGKQNRTIEALEERIEELESSE